MVKLPWHSSCIPTHRRPVWASTLRTGASPPEAHHTGSQSSTMYERIIQHLIPEAEFHQNRYAKELDRAVRPGELWLDLGAGKRIHGGWERPQSELARRAGYLVGCDIALDGLSRNPLLGAGVAGDACALPFRTNTFGLVTANMVLEHLDSPLLVFREISRVLAPGGSFVFVTPNRVHPAVRVFSWLLTSDVRRRAARLLEGRQADDIFHTHYRANTSHDLTRLATDAGLDIAELEVFSSYPMFRRPAPLTVAESIWIRAVLRAPRLQGLGSNLLGRFRKLSAVPLRKPPPSLAKPASPSARTTPAAKRPG